MSKPNHKLFLWILLLFLLVLTAIVASATTLAPMSFDELTRRATAIVRVRCVGVQSRWSGGEVWTDSRFVILEEAKADAFGADQHITTPVTAKVDSPAAPLTLGNIVVRQLGGSIDGLHSRVEGVPQFQPGEEAYLFLWRRAAEPYRVLGWVQGTFRVTRDQRSGVARVTQDSALTVFHGETREFQSEGIRNMSLA